MYGTIPIWVLADRYVERVSVVGMTRHPTYLPAAPQHVQMFPKMNSGCSLKRIALTKNTTSTIVDVPYFVVGNVKHYVCFL